MRLFLKIATISFFYIIYKATNIFNPQKFVGVLMYHSIEGSTWKYGVSPKTFARQIDYIKKHYNVVSTKEIVSYIKGEKMLPDNSLALTFDDGYEDTYAEVFPLLKKYNLPATIFLTTNLEKKASLGNLARPTWDQIKEMQQSGLISVEVHGHDHKNLIQELGKDPTLKNELQTCQNLIQEKTTHTSNILAYASGHKNKEVIEAVKNFGFIAGLDINEGIIRPGDDPFRIKRIQIDRTMNFFLFKLRLTPALELNRRFVDKIRK